MVRAGPSSPDMTAPSQAAVDSTGTQRSLLANSGSHGKFPRISSPAGACAREGRTACLDDGISNRMIMTMACESRLGETARKGTSRRECSSSGLSAGRPDQQAMDQFRSWGSDKRRKHTPKDALTKDTLIRRRHSSESTEDPDSAVSGPRRDRSLAISSMADSADSEPAESRSSWAGGVRDAAIII
ncbi:hypothetical protein M011DRAFT_54371 [Sporormia fimetaria CBS 119925]|uniref:Uncharacterized protein n=1 Tax=Sporormia fimetaria CBS 119925 TaxID=1340428 RepID=A0A6A6VAZ6_9PLEO|nr:hypothetical protein M011DRAFT_54371 [Sporormia fimetaria CBS 119925]